MSVNGVSARSFAQAGRSKVVKGDGWMLDSAPLLLTVDQWPYRYVENCESIRLSWPLVNSYMQESYE